MSLLPGEMSLVRPDPGLLSLCLSLAAHWAASVRLTGTSRDERLRGQENSLNLALNSQP